MRWDDACNYRATLVEVERGPRAYDASRRRSRTNRAVTAGAVAMIDASSARPEDAADIVLPETTIPRPPAVNVMDPNTKMAGDNSDAVTTCDPNVKTMPIVAAAPLGL